MFYNVNVTCLTGAQRGRDRVVVLIEKKKKNSDEKKRNVRSAFLKQTLSPRAFFVRRPALDIFHLHDFNN